ncbi:1085_t:CDS:2 [Diversispora eburnea]|uniref:1085_t:CDS:1 n=1 Tax=Diversispora eburnea TaxID=1213867 RepID=A0A9N9GA40_9GLOM|nr:1085_t:CDS:2 [Diversispora eburnea]
MILTYLNRYNHTSGYTFIKNTFPSILLAFKSTTSSNVSVTNPAPEIQLSLIKRLFNNFGLFKTSFLRGKNTNIMNSYKIKDAPKFIGKAETWNQAIMEAEELIQHRGGSHIDPIRLVGKDFSDLTKNIQILLGSGHPMLNTVSKYYFTSEGKHIRPLIVLLMSQATSIAPKQYNAAPTDFFQIIDKPLSPSIPLNHNKDDNTSTFSNRVKYSSISSTGTILPTQRRLAEITEMIHTASLFHDDVIDFSETRRNKLSVNMNFGNKLAILAGDFLLARASVALAKLRNPEVIELLATVLANLVEGEFMQLKNMQEHETMSTFEYYLEKTYMKTASLIAKSCRASTVLGGATLEVCDIAYTYGRNLGKPVDVDLKLGLATAPVLYAWKDYPELGPLIKRKFSQEGDVEKARELVYRSKGIEQTKLLAALHCEKAIAAISKLPESDARNALIQLTHKVLIRKK